MFQINDKCFKLMNQRFGFKNENIFFSLKDPPNVGLSILVNNKYIHSISPSSVSQCIESIYVRTIYISTVSSVL